MKSEKRLSLCLITRDAEEYLADCIKATGCIADEIVVADLGSKDKTVDIALGLGADVYRLEWKHDYSAIKNFCMDQARGRWILFLQPNERIAAGHLKLIRPLLHNPNAEGYLLYLDQPQGQYQIKSPLQSLRLIRNRREYRFRHKAFEYIPDNLIANIRETGVRISQLSNREPAYDAGLFALLEEDLQEEPENSYLQYIYGIELFNRNRYEDSLEHFRKAHIAVNHSCLYGAHLYKCLAWNLMILGKHDDALEILNKGTEYYPFYTDLLILRAELKKNRSQLQEAMQDLVHSLSIKKQNNDPVPAPEITAAVILENLGELHAQMLNYRHAYDCYLQAFELNQTNYEILYKIGELPAETGIMNTVDQLLKNAEEGDLPELLMTLIDILYRRNEYEKVLKHLVNMDAYLDRKQLESIRISCFYMLGKSEQAEQALLSLEKKPPYYQRALMEKIEIRWCFGRYQEAEPLLEELNQIEGVASSTKELYWLIHEIFTKEGQTGAAFIEIEYEAVARLMEKLLWLNQTDRAKLLLPLLPDAGAEDDKLVEMALWWAKPGEVGIIDEIFSHLTDSNRKKEFVVKVVYELIRCGHFQDAEKLAGLAKPSDLGALEYVLWSEGIMQDMKRWIKMAESNPLQPNDNNILSIIHLDIGCLYEKKDQLREAIFAYLRSLQWNPLEERTLEKIKRISDADQDLFHAILYGGVWPLEGERFYSKASFINFVAGVLHFNNKRYGEALEKFQLLSDDKGFRSHSAAYAVLCLRLSGRISEAEALLKQNENLTGLFDFVSKIAKSCVLAKLNEGFEQYPGSEVIQDEEQRVLSSFSGDLRSG